MNSELPQGSLERLRGDTTCRVVFITLADLILDGAAGEGGVRLLCACVWGDGGEVVPICCLPYAVVGGGGEKEPEVDASKILSLRVRCTWPILQRQTIRWMGGIVFRGVVCNVKAIFSGC